MPKTVTENVNDDFVVLYNTHYEGHGQCVASKCINGSKKEVAVNCGLLQRPLCGS